MDCSNVALPSITAKERQHQTFDYQSISNTKSNFGNQDTRGEIPKEVSQCPYLDGGKKKK